MPSRSATGPTHPRGITVTRTRIIEALCSSFHAHFGPSAGLHNPRNTVEYLKRGLDVIHAEALYGGAIGDAVTERLLAMLCFPRLVFLFKGRPHKQLPGYRGPDCRTMTAARRGRRVKAHA